VSVVGEVMSAYLRHDVEEPEFDVEEWWVLFEFIISQWRLCRVYYQVIKRDPNIRPIYECRCDERLKTTGE
jgi:hypothetical protein